MSIRISISARFETTLTLERFRNVRKPGVRCCRASPSDDIEPHSLGLDGGLFPGSSQAEFDLELSGLSHAKMENLDACLAGLTAGCGWLHRASHEIEFGGLPVDFPQYAKVP